MHIKRLEIAGFKSFVDRTVIHFDHDVIGVVGPNGCGKSNIVDAVKWVLGEMSSKELRGDSMGDVIFNGSEHRPPLGMAEVTLVFDNEEGRGLAYLAGQPEIALNSATSLAFREALRAAGAVVLEPYGRLEIRVPEDYLGGVVKTLNQRRAVVKESRFTRGISLIRGVAPIGEMFGYLTVLRSHTQGRGSYSLEPLDYRPLPDILIALHHERLY